MAVQEVEAFFEAHKAYFENRDVQGIMSNHLDASLFWDQGGGNLKGRNEIRGWFSLMFGLWNIKSADYELAMIRCNEKLASCAVIWTLEGHEEGNPEAYKKACLKVTYCLEKTEQGWKIWHAHSSEC
jgi:ketosteroid isomerase-like protein